jgi:hypothetical protein
MCCDLHPPRITECLYCETSPWLRISKKSESSSKDKADIFRVNQVIQFRGASRRMDSPTPIQLFLIGLACMLLRLAMPSRDNK